MKILRNKKTKDGDIISVLFIELEFWSPEFKRNKHPQQQNTIVLKRAWLNIWNIDSLRIPILTKREIILIWLIVEKATIFFKSTSKLAIIPPKIKVVKVT